MNVKSLLSLIGVVSLVAAALPQKASAAFWIGGLVGTERSGEDSSHFLAYGGTAGFKFGVLPIALGAFGFKTKTRSASMGGFRSAVTHSFYGLEPSLIFGSNLMLKVGVKVGQNEVTGNTRDARRNRNLAESSRELGAGPTVGIDWKIIPFFSVGVEATVEHVFDDTSYNLFQGLAAVKLWL